MSRSRIALVLVLLAAGSAAHAFTREQIAAYDKLSIVDYVGRKDRCPGYQLHQRNFYTELFAAGFRPADFDTDEFNEIRVKSLTEIILMYNRDRGKTCALALEVYGPTGTNERPMLERK